MKSIKIILISVLLILINQFSFGQTYILSGRAHSGYGVTKDAKALLYYHQQPYYDAGLVAMTDVTDGNFTFFNLQKQNYLLYIIPNPAVDSLYFPSYYINKLQPGSATVITLQGNINGLDVQLVRKPTMSPGTGKISGNATHTYGSSDWNTVYGTDWFNSSAENFNAVQNLPVFLYDNNNNPIMWALTDRSGNFTFYNVPNNKYYFSIERYGFKIAPPDPGYHTVSNDYNSSIQLYVQSNSVVTSINKDDTIEPPLVYPNPFSEKLNLSIFLEKSENVLLKIYNSIGKIMVSDIYSLAEGNNKIELYTEHFTSGLYYGTIEWKEKSHNFKVIK